MNTQDISPFTLYNLANLSPVDIINPVSLALLASHFCDTGFVKDGFYIAVNGTQLGLLGGSDANSALWTCKSTYANFAHYNDTLFGLDDVTPDSLMAATDVLADIKSYVNNGDTSVDVVFTYQSTFRPFSNPIRAVMLSYSTPCDTFSTNITANDTICFGESIQLQAAGGKTYSWFGAFGGLSDTRIANPIATPPQTSTYIVTIKNDSGCVKIDQVKIWVNPFPEPTANAIVNNFCGSKVGSFQVGNISSNTQPYSYNLTNLATSNSQL
tara:strand:+ start:1169 stop:1975 length:807 start_codon:yes stop_codon:yes gene_type:complete